MEQSLSSSEKSNPGVFKSISAGSVVDSTWGYFKPNVNDTYLMIVGPSQQAQFKLWKENPDFNILFESEQAINTNYISINYNSKPTKNRFGYNIYQTYYKPRNTVVVFEYAPAEKSSS